VKNAQRYLADASLGQHQHVWYHKYSYSYASPITGFISLVIYANLLFYTITRFLDIGFERTFNTLTLYQPLDLSLDTTLTVGQFFTAAGLHFFYTVVPGDPDCSQYQGSNYVSIYTTNPRIYLPFNSTYDPEQGACRADLAPQVFRDPHRLNSNFSIYFYCYNCTGGMDVAMT